MVTLQEWFNKSLEEDKRDKSKKKTFNVSIFKMSGLLANEVDGGELDLTGWEDLREISINGKILKSPVKKIILGNHPKLTKIKCPDNELGIDFVLEELKKVKETLEFLDITHNNIYERGDGHIYPVDAEVFSELKKINTLKIGNNLKDGSLSHYNRFKGSLRAFRDMKNLVALDISGTDISGGLEWLPERFADLLSTDHGILKDLAKFNYDVKDSTKYNRNDFDTKCRVIKDELSNFKNIKAWQFANPEKMYKVRPELFDDQEWVDALEKRKDNLKEEVEKMEAELKGKIEASENRKRTGSRGGGRWLGGFDLDHFGKDKIEKERDKIKIVNDKYNEALEVLNLINKQRERRLEEQLENEKLTVGDFLKTQRGWYEREFPEIYKEIEKKLKERKKLKQVSEEEEVSVYDITSYLANQVNEKDEEIRSLREKIKQLQEKLAQSQLQNNQK